MDLFLVKKAVGLLVMPINMIILSLFIALIFHRRKPKLSFAFLLMATMSLLLSTLSPVSDRFMTQLENGYPTYNKSGVGKVDYIVILGCRHTDAPDLPVTSRLGDCSLERLVEALRIHQLHPEAKFITSGHSSGDKESHAEVVKQALVLMGVPEQNIVAESLPRDTEEEAYFISRRVLNKRFILVTNADHMKRAMRYFHGQGVNPIPAPTGYWVKNPNGKAEWQYFLPSGKNLYQTTIAWYESLGLFVQWIKQK